MHGTDPTVQASWPGSITNYVAGTVGDLRPVVSPNCHLTRYANTGVCLAWQESVPAIGLTSSDHFQPGSKAPRPRVKPPRVTTSMWPWARNGRVSSGADGGDHLPRQARLIWRRGVARAGAAGRSLADKLATVRVPNHADSKEVSGASGTVALLSRALGAACWQSTSLVERIVFSVEGAPVGVGVGLRVCGDCFVDGVEQSVLSD
jgi:hypothetical protein